MNGESLANTLFIISNIAFVASAIFAILAVFFFVKFKIPSVISDLTGRTARKSIAEMRSSSKQDLKKAYDPSRMSRDNNKNGDLFHDKTYTKMDESTTLLTESTTEILLKPKEESVGRVIRLIEEIIYVHTDEKIK